MSTPNLGNMPSKVGNGKYLDIARKSYELKTPAIHLAPRWPQGPIVRDGGGMDEEFDRW